MLDPWPESLLGAHAGARAHDDIVTRQLARPARNYFVNRFISYRIPVIFI